MLRTSKKMISTFRTVGIIGHPHHSNDLAIHKMLYHWLNEKGITVIMEYQTAHDLELTEVITGSLTDIGEHTDLAIIVGGDGNMLGAARILARYGIKVIGINRGSLGFLTDLDPDSALVQLSDVLSGHYQVEKRFLLEVQIFRDNVCRQLSTAINEMMLHPGKVAHMIEFEVYIDDSFAFSLRSDGLIITTPTGSTAYSLSAGGPILTPTVDAIALIPMFPHTLSSRPLVINSSSIICLKFSQLTSNIEINCDSQIALPIQKGEEILINRSNYHLDLIHPINYNYFNILSKKLGWSQKFF